MTAVDNFFKPAPEMREQSFLEELERNPAVSQRALSRKLGIALGVTNACVKSMERKGWIERRNLDHNKNGYFLTPEGVAEKMRLTAHLIAWKVHNYTALRKIIEERFLELQEAGIERVVFYGVSNELEIALAALQRTKLKLVGIVEDPGQFRSQIVFGYEVEPVTRVTELKPECILISALEAREEKKERLRTLVDWKKVYVGDICMKET
jgi:DNA-binding MarR family transcriptional regulator